jgi:sporulation protein YlmC with PRC-barrel domain
MRIKELLGMLALDINANEIGKISDIDFDPESGVISQVAVTLKKNIVSSNEIVIPFADIKSIGDYVLVNKTVEKEPTVEVETETESEKVDLE